jgi:hypothetical protein
MHGDNMNMTSQSENIGISRVPASELERSEKRRSELQTWWYLLHYWAKPCSSVFSNFVFKLFIFF